MSHSGSSSSSGGSDLDDSDGASTGKRGLPSSPGARDLLTIRGAGDGSQSSSELSDHGQEGNGQEGTSGEVGSASSSVIVAQPPRGSGNDSSLQEIVLTGSEALDVLDQLLVKNEIGKERAARLRRKYNLLRETLENSRQLESSLLVQAKELSVQLSQQRRVLDKGASFPDGDTSESGRLRQILLTHQNEIDMSGERTAKLEQQIKLLEEEVGQLEREHSRMPKKEELEQLLRQLDREKDSLADEINMRSQDALKLKSELDKRNLKLAALAQEMDELKHVEELQQSELIEIRSGPNLPKEIEIVKKQIREVEDTVKEQDQLLKQLMPQISEAESRADKMRSDLVREKSVVDKGREGHRQQELDLERLSKDLSMAKEREASLLEDRATLELRWKHACAENKALFESQTSKTRDKDRQLKLLKKAELQLSTVQQSLEQVQRKFTLLEERKQTQSQALAWSKERRQEVSKEVDSLRKELALMEGFNGQHQAILDEMTEKDASFKQELKRRQAVLHDLNRDLVAMTKSRDHDARDYYKARRQQRLISDDRISKDVQIEDTRKRIKELETKLTDFATAYEIVKAERNKTHAQILLLGQVGAELTEKTKILGNEIEILRTSSDTKEQILQKCSLVQTAKVLERDTQRQELNKVKQSQAEVSYQMEGTREEIHKLTQQINQTELQLNKLRHRYEQSIQERNDLGLQLIERNEEVCVFYEKLNVQESIIRQANLELTSREEELSFLRMELSRLQNDVLVGRKALPEKEKVERDLVNAQIQLKCCEQRMRELESAVENASDPHRLRLLPGDCPSRNDISNKIEQLEVQLGECEQTLLEKELLYEQVGKLVSRASQRAEGQRESTLTVAKKVNHYQSKIRDTTRKMMAMVSELSMQQATALQLEQEVKERETDLEQAYTRLEAGEPPTEDAAQHWNRMLRSQALKTQDTEMRRAVAEDEESRMLPSGVLTSAEPRPNAYMPSTEGDLPVPKPYGNHAPFKPTAPGANIRHIRKPQPKPIDI